MAAHNQTSPTTLQQSVPPLQRRPSDSVIPLTTGQQWMLQELRNLDAPLCVRMCAAAVRLWGPLNIKLLQTSIEMVVQRHAALRTRVITEGGSPQQLIDPAHERPMELVPMYQLYEIFPAAAEQATMQLGWKFLDKMIDLAQGPLFEAKLFRLSCFHHVLILVLDHIVSDATSVVVLNKEIWTLYRQLAHGQPTSLPELPIQFADYAVWQHQTYDLWLHKHGEYWKQHLDGIPPLNLPRDGTPGISQLMLATVFFDQALTTSLRTLAQREATLFSLLFLSLYAVVLSHWCGQQNFVLGFASHQRHRRELQNMIGYLATEMPLRIDIAPGDSFRDLLQRIQQEFRAVYQRQDLGHSPHHLIPHSVPNVNFNWVRDWMDNGTRPMQVDDHLTLQGFPLQPDRLVDAPLIKDFTAMFYESPDGVMLSICYQWARFSQANMERFTQHFKWVATQIADNPNASLDSLNHLS